MFTSRVAILFGSLLNEALSEFQSDMQITYLISSMHRNSTWSSKKSFLSGLNYKGNDYIS